MNTVFDDMISKLKARKELLINNVKDIQTRQLNEIKIRKELYQTRLNVCNKCSIDVDKLVKQPINMSALNQRETKINDMVTKYYDDSKSENNGPIPDNIQFDAKNISEMVNLIDNAGSVTIQNPCSVSFTLTVGKFSNKIQLLFGDYDVKSDSHDEFKVSYKHENENSEHILKVSLKKNNNSCIQIPILNDLGLYIFKISHFDGFQWSLYSSPESINIKEIKPEWETNNYWKSNKIGINNKTNIITTHAKMEYASTFIKNIIKYGKYMCKFKINSNITEWGIRFGIYKTNAGKPGMDTYSKTKKGCSYAFISHGYLESIDKPGSAGNKYGRSLKKNDDIIMIIDLNNNELSYIINDINYGKAFNIQNTSYKIGICLHPGNSVQLISLKIC